ncbi:hypothetical protein GCM10022214_49870 [Actinomadura miaoliensis]|uniref:Uncharacterized protein n=1 Tax=Actinomadura miaoliensis TaxID=430685 RepID=A0ABP7W9Z4_9ACTN
MGAMPIRPVRHVQKTAPGPLREMAVAAPTVVARAVTSAWWWEMSPSVERLAKGSQNAGRERWICGPRGMVVR